jgi:hypothetical protein
MTGGAGRGVKVVLFGESPGTAKIPAFALVPQNPVINAS